MSRWAARRDGYTNWLAPRVGNTSAKRPDGHAISALPRSPWRPPVKAADIAAIPDKRYGTCADLPLAEAAANCRWLSGHCDGAHSRDGAGWSALGQARRARRWLKSGTPNGAPPIWITGRHLSHKYRKQLASRPASGCDRSAGAIRPHHRARHDATADGDGGRAKLKETA